MIGRIDRLTNKGYGFIETESGDRVWFHATRCYPKRFDELTVGERVEVEYDRDDLGRFSATSVSAQ